MNELRPLTGRDARRALLPLFPGARDTLLLSGLQGHLGQALLSADEKSGMVLVGGFAFLGGVPRAALIQAAMNAQPWGFLTFSGSPDWLSLAKALGAGKEMTRFDLETPAHFDEARLRRLARPPAGFRLQRVDTPALYEACRMAGGIGDIVNNYADYAAFSRHGLAIAALKGDEIAAGCGAYAHADGQLEVEIDTAGAYRRQGLATACGAAFVLACLEKGLRPHWDAMTPVSAALAAKLGFVHPRPYPVVCREGE